MQHRLPRRDPKYGRFPPNRMFHVDQVPLPFVATGRASLNPKGDMCSVKVPNGGKDDKRFCTLQVCICAQGDAQIIHLEVFFRGEGKKLRKEEWDHYDKLAKWIKIRFQPKAWCDGDIALQWLGDFRDLTLPLGEVLLGMDGLKSQITATHRAFMDVMSIRYAITPPNCTDTTSPVDRHIGKWLKGRIAEFFKAEFSSKSAIERWEKKTLKGGIRDRTKRMLIASWAAMAWQEMQRDKQYLIEQAFVQTGFLLAADGSENHLVMPWKLKKAKDGDKLHAHSNTSPEGVPYNFGPPPPNALLA